MTRVIPGGLYQHFKGNYYIVLGVGAHSETHEQLVFYKSTNGDMLWARPLTSFISEVKVDDKTIPRFKEIVNVGVPLGLTEQQENK